VERQAGVVVTRSLLVDPGRVRKKGTLRLEPIGVNRYDRTIADERDRYGDARLVGVLRSMVVIRELETMLEAIKRGKDYHGLTYDYRGPAHLSIGQEGAAAGQAVALGLDDHTFGSHRSHGEIVARGMEAVAAWTEPELEALMASYLSGRPAEVVARRFGGADVRERACAFFLYGLVAEIFGRATGFNQGVGGSMHAFFPPFGIHPNNAIVGGAATIAAGAALFKRAQDRSGIVVANIGDGSTGCGTVWEAMNFAAMGQFRSLFDERHRGGLPLLFFFVNNFYAMGGQTIGETMGYDRLARIGAGVDPQNMHAETIDGTRPLAVADAVTRAKELLAAGEGPVLIDCQCYRYSGHSPSDASSYRTREELELWRELDPIPRFRDELLAAGVLEPAAALAIEEWAAGLLLEVAQLAVDDAVSPRLSVPDIERLTFSDREDDAHAAPPGETVVPLEQTERWQQLRSRPREAIQLREALYEAIAQRAVQDDRLVIYGEENRDWGGAFGVYRGLTELLPYRRLFNAPISEAAIVGTAVGYAMEGGRALVELMYADFMGRAGDEIFNQLAKWTAMSGGTLRLPVVVRVSVGSAYGAQHSQDWTSLVAHVPGLKVVYPVTPYDAKGLMTAALAQDDPIFFFESQRLYSVTEQFRPGGVPAGDVRVRIGEPRVVRPGSDVTLLTFGPTLYRALEAANELAARYGVEAEVIDARSLVPLELEQIVESVRKTSRLLVASDATQRGSYANTIAAEVQRAAFDYLDAPVVVVGSPDCVTPSADLEDDYFPGPRRIIDELHRSVLRLPGHALTA
jgi:2-oxoisovalerate dehydrogenase E1 component